VFDLPLGPVGIRGTQVIQQHPARASIHIVGHPEALGSAPAAQCLHHLIAYYFDGSNARG
jgi:hypothetical protein